MPLWLLVPALGLAACGDAATGARGDPAPSVAIRSTADGRPAASAIATAAPAPDVDAVAILARAAATDVREPRADGTPGAVAYYRHLARRVVPASDANEYDAYLERPKNARYVVMDALARSADPRASRALMGWALAPDTDTEARGWVLRSMRDRPHVEYGVVAERLLEDAKLSDGITRVADVRGAKFPVNRTSLSNAALDLAMALPSGAGEALVRGVAEDRAREKVDMRILAKLTCPKGTLYLEREARPLASVRLMALAALGDAPLLERVANDRTESRFARDWARLLLSDKEPTRGPPYDLDKHPWEGLVPHRDRSSSEPVGALPFVLSYLGSRDTDAAPCVSL